jgi:hypothetical protein
MSIEAKTEYLGEIYGKYQTAGRAYKKILLDGFCAICGYHRKAALRLLSGSKNPAAKKKKRPGPKKKYDSAKLLGPLKTIWLLAEQPCGKRLRAALPLWLPHIQKGLTEVNRGKLLNLSAATIDRLLAPARVRHPRRGLSTTRPGTLIREVNLRAGPANTTEPGHVEADTVAHCGQSVAGDFIYSLTVTDPASGWTENRAVWNKGAAGILAQLQNIEASLPFELKSFHSDNGTEFLNWPLKKHLNERQRPVPFTRSRPYRKNDNAHVEQKNWTHVRQLFGHERLEDPQLVNLMNSIYQNEARLLRNFFSPSFKLLAKQKLNSRYKRVYEEPKTPAERLLESPQVQNDVKDKIRSLQKQLNPIQLAEQLEHKLRLFFNAKSNLSRESTMP